METGLEIKYHFTKLDEAVAWQLKVSQAKTNDLIEKRVEKMTTFKKKKKNKQTLRLVIYSYVKRIRLKRMSPLCIGIKL